MGHVESKTKKLDIFIRKFNGHRNFKKGHNFAKVCSSWIILRSMKSRVLGRDQSLNFTDNKIVI